MERTLYDLRKQAHEAFDPLWKTGKRTRSGAYLILQDILKLPKEQAHISMLNEEQCRILINRLETGNYWIGAGKKLHQKRRVWVHPNVVQSKVESFLKDTRKLLRRKIRFVFYIETKHKPKKPKQSLIPRFIHWLRVQRHQKTPDQLTSQPVRQGCKIPVDLAV